MVSTGGSISSTAQNPSARHLCRNCSTPTINGIDLGRNGATAAEYTVATTGCAKAQVWTEPRVEHRRPLVAMDHIDLPVSHESV